ncbi:MAG: hypothetical protein FJ386_07845 [Verrucomicrobia bacterium]|nr:hypothetical protein [Verrucomicrobiota bacterium]
MSARGDITGKDPVSSVPHSASRIPHLAIALCLTSLRLFSAPPDFSKLPPASEAPVEFARDIQPIFEKSCLRCHGAARPKGRFRLDNAASALKGGAGGVALIPGHSARSPLIHYVAGLVEDMQMPPKGKGEPLTREEIGTLRAWIDAGAAWPAASATSSFSHGIAMFIRGVGVSGNERVFREHWGFREGLGAGLERLELSQQPDPDTRLTLHARALPLDDDYRMRLAWERGDAGFVRGGIEQFRRYYHDTGGDYAPFGTPSFRLGRDLSLDTGRAWIEFGLTRPELPRMVVGYEYLFRDGAMSTLEWGDSTQGGVNKAIFPAFKEIAEHTHVIRFDLDAERDGTRVENYFRAEFTGLATRKSTVSLVTTPGAVPDRFVSTREAHRGFQGTDTLRVEREFKEWLTGSAAYFYSRVSADAALSQVTTDLAGATVDGERWFANQLLLERESHLMSASILAGPWRGLTVSAAAQGEFTRQRGLGDADRQVVFFGVPFPDASPQRSDLDVRRVSEHVALRWTGLPHTVVFAEGRFEQEDHGIFEQQPAGNEPFLRRTDALGDWREWRAGIHAAPWERVTLSVTARHRSKRTDYTHIDPVVPAAGHPYPGFLRLRDTDTDELEARLALRAASWWRTTLAYRLTASDYTTATDGYPALTPGGAIAAGNYDAHVWSAGHQFAPWNGWLFHVSGSYAESRLATAQNGASYVVPFRGGVLSTIAGVTWTLNESTDLRASHTFSRADYGQNNVATGLPAGAEFERHGVLAGVTRRLGKRATGNLQYGFFQYAEPAAGAAYDYTAHGVFATLTLAWP